MFLVVGKRPPRQRANAPTRQRDNAPARQRASAPRQRAEYTKPNWPARPRNRLIIHFSLLEVPLASLQLLCHNTIKRVLESHARLRLA